MTGNSVQFAFATASKIVFGTGASDALSDAAAGLGRRALLVMSRSASTAFDAKKKLAIPHEPFWVSGEPDTTVVEEGAQIAVAGQCDVVIAVGGGSVIDAGKAISALFTNRDGIMTYLEVIGEGKPLSNTPVPFIAVPTTAGTGSEVTRNAVLASTAHHVKVSMRSESMLPNIAIVDPHLTMGVPPQITAATGLDALTQLIEPYVSVKANPLTDALCEVGIQRVARSLRTAFDDGANLPAREDMAIASLFGGLALANAGLGAVHGFAGPMGGMFPIPHGVVCGRLLPIVFRTNAAAVKDHPDILQKFERVSRLVTGNPQSTVDDGIRWLDNLCAHLQLNGLAHYGVVKSDFDRIIDAAKRASSMKRNPVILTDDALTDILTQAM